jgi:hypothetical protein
MKTKGWLAAALAASGMVYAIHTGGCLNSKAPDEKLAGHFEDLCEIARNNIDSPEKGVRQLGRYFGKHTGDMLGEFGDTIATIEKIDDEDKHDDRAAVARDRIHAPWIACGPDWQRFFDAVDRDPGASQTLQHGIERLGRTLEIIFPGMQGDFRRLPYLISNFQVAPSVP